MSIVLSTNIMEKYISYLLNEEKSENTITKYSHDIEHFMSYVKKHKITTETSEDITKEISKEIVLEYKNKLISENYSPRSVNSILA